MAESGGEGVEQDSGAGRAGGSRRRPWRRRSGRGASEERRRREEIGGVLMTRVRCSRWRLLLRGALLLLTLPYITIWLASMSLIK